nr:hypothetical protein [uncultured Desulfobacter sp.]
MIDKRLSRADANLALDIIHHSLSCKTKTHFEDLLTELHALMGFDYVRSVVGKKAEFIQKGMSAFQLVTPPSRWNGKTGIFKKGLHLRITLLSMLIILTAFFTGVMRQAISPVKTAPGLFVKRQTSDLLKAGYSPRNEN